MDKLLANSQVRLKVKSQDKPVLVQTLPHKQEETSLDRLQLLVMSLDQLKAQLKVQPQHQEMSLAQPKAPPQPQVTSLDPPKVPPQPQATSLDPPMVPPQPQVTSLDPPKVPPQQLAMSKDKSTVMLQVLVMLQEVPEVLLKATLELMEMLQAMPKDQDQDQPAVMPKVQGQPRSHLPVVLQVGPVHPGMRMTS